jgi:methionyl aminopeptidase
VIEIFSPAELGRARDSGALVGHILHTVSQRVGVGTNLLEIDEWTREMIVEAGAESCYVDYAPSFGRGPFGHWICTAVNDAVLHGLPHDYALRDGDLLTLDLAVVLNGIAADSALSFVVGTSRPAGSTELIETTERALAAAIAAAVPGAKMGDVSYAIGSVLTETTECAPACCSPSSRGSWPTPTSSSPTTTAGRSAARPAASRRTASTRSPSPRTAPRS